MTASQVGQARGFDRAAERKETTAKQLAVSIGMPLHCRRWVKGNPNALAAAVLDGQTLRANPAILGSGKIEHGARAPGLAGVAYTAEEVDEVRKLLQAQAGDEFNRSAEELASLHETTAQ